jgi:signal transduction histidine kinase/ActR/RegA family two-component response regulator
LDPGEAPGKPIALFHPQKWRIKLRDEIFPSVMRGEGNWLGEAQLLNVRTDQPIDVLMNIFSVRHPATNEILCYATVMRDITERKRTEREREHLLAQEQVLRRQAEAAGRIKDEFLATVSHELRTPLNSILGWASMLRAGQLQKPIVPRALEAIERNARLQAQLIEDLLDVSRIISGKLRLNMKSVDVGPIVQAAVDSVRPAANAKQIQLQITVDPNTGGVTADEARLQQIIWNLLSNSVKFTPGGGTVRLRVGRTKSGVQISVSDTGQGIKQEFLPFVFDRFQQADASITRKHGGLGLGLAIARHLVEMHGGIITASSEGEGRGATFTVSLPCAPEPTHSIDHAVLDSAAARHTNQNGTPDLSGIRVLAIDDAEDTRQLLRQLVSQCGADIITASSASEGLQVMTADRPDIIICDIGMPEEDGYSFIRKARTLSPPNSATVPAIALTGYVRVEDRVRALDAGYQMFVPKPVQPAELLRIVATLVGRAAE